jgi:outer membrane putative beta-barrel porin/alpha-amylase
VPAASRNALAAAIGLTLAAPAFAGHPMLTEDTGTQGTGNAELELGYSWADGDGDRTFVFQPQLSYGVSTTFDLIVQPSWIDDQEAGASAERDFGDTALDFKWRFYGAAPLSLGIRAGVTAPTSAQGLGLPDGKTSEHAMLVATVDASQFTVDANLGIAVNPDVAGLRQRLYHASAAAMYARTERLSFVLDLDVDSNPDAKRSAWPAVGLVGVIYTLRSGLDVDVGYRSALNSAAVAKQWLLGLTYRWAP